MSLTAIDALDSINLSNTRVQFTSKWYYGRWALHAVPDVERDGHYSVEHDDVREENHERDDGGALGLLVGHVRVPRQEVLEAEADETLPHTAAHGADETHDAQEDEDLQRHTNTHICL